MGNFLGPLRSGVQQRLYQDTDGLRRLIRREIQELRRKLDPFMDEAHKKINRNLEQLRSRLMPYTEEMMDKVGWGAQELHLQLGPYENDMKKEAFHSLAENFQDRISLHTGKVKQVFFLLSERLLGEIHQAAEELHGNLVPHAHTSKEKLSQQVKELSRKLSENARDLHHKIQLNLNELKVQLGSYPQALKERFPEGQDLAPVAPYVEEMTAQVQREVEAFNRNTQLQIEDFTRFINRQTEDMEHILSPASQDFQDSVSSIEDVQKSLDSLWQDISGSMH
ncbi:apolipoprotein A-V isoform X2 [Bombina bombina]|nr:apolipoprotein A-V isoform X2 [Bombina bombina]